MKSTQALIESRLEELQTFLEEGATLIKELHAFLETAKLEAKVRPTKRPGKTRTPGPLEAALIGQVLSTEELAEALGLDRPQTLIALADAQAHGDVANLRVLGHPGYWVWVLDMDDLSNKADLNSLCEAVIRLTGGVTKGEMVGLTRGSDPERQRNRVQSTLNTIKRRFPRGSISAPGTRKTVYTIGPDTADVVTTKRSKRTTGTCPKCGAQNGNPCKTCNYDRTAKKFVFQG